MSFSTNVFLYFFFPLLIIGSFLFHKKAGIYKFLVFLANIFFYIWAGPVALCILIGMIIIVWCFIHIIQSLNNTTVKRFLFIISIVIVLNCALLSIQLFSRFKVYHFKQPFPAHCTGNIYTFHQAHYNPATGESALCCRT